MITATFALSGLAVLMLQVLTMDTLEMIRRTWGEVAPDFDHDTKIFPDYIP